MVPKKYLSMLSNEKRNHVNHSVQEFSAPFCVIHVADKEEFISDNLSLWLNRCLLLDWLDDVELAGVCPGSGSLSGFIRRFTINANTQCAVGPDRPAGVS